MITPRTRLIYLNFPSNPTGGVASRAELEAIAEVILRRAPEDCRVYSDEIYEKILFDGAKHESIASVPGMAERTILVSGASKTYSWTGGRLGWAVFPTEREAGVFRNLNINYFSCVSPYTQLGAVVALESPESVKSIAMMNAAFQKRRDLVVDGLNAIDGIRCQKPRGAFYVFPNIEGVCRSLGVIDAYEQLAPELKARTTPSTLFQMFLLFRWHVATMDRKSFGRIGTEGKHYLRLSIATAETDLAEAVGRIRSASTDRSGFADFVREGRHLA